MATTQLGRTGAAARTGRMSLKELREQLPNYLFVLPHLFLFLLFLAYPIIRGLQMSLYDWQIMATEQRFVGTRNYQALFRDSIWWGALWNTIVMAGLTVIGVTFVSLLAAAAIKRNILGRDLFRVLFYAPVILSVAVMGLLMQRVFSTELGLLNYIIVDWLGGPQVNWLSDPNIVKPAISMATIWWSFGFPMLVFLAGLQNIPEHLYEAAKIDGATGIQSFLRITLPLLVPVMLFVLVTQFLAHMQIFGQPFLMTRGGPGRSSQTVMMYLYDTAWKFWRMGYASAMAVGLAAIMIVATLVLFRVFRARPEY